MGTNALSDGTHTSFQREVVVAVLEGFVMVVAIVAFSCLFFNNVEFSREVVTVLLKQQTDVYIDEYFGHELLLKSGPQTELAAKDKQNACGLVNKRLTFPILV
jgi:hypothetical protein